MNVATLAGGPREDDPHTAPVTFDELVLFGEKTAPAELNVSFTAEPCLPKRSAKEAESYAGAGALP